MKYEVPSSARRPVASMFARLTGQPRGAASGSRELGIAGGYGVGVAASVGSGQWKPASVGGELGMAARRALGLAADTVEEAGGAAEADGAAAGGRTARSSADSTTSAAKANAAAARGRGHGRIGLGRVAFMLR